LRAFYEGFFSNQKKEFKGFKGEEVLSMTPNDMPIISGGFGGKAEGVDMACVCMVLGADKPVGIFGDGPAKSSGDSDADLDTLLSTIRKIV
jgi:hypothetical protein